MEEIFTAIAFIVATVASYNLGKIAQQPETRKETIQWCIQKSQECKKEFDFYKTQAEVRKFQENSK